MLTLPGYAIKEKFFEDGRSQIFRATRVSDSLAVILKVPAASSFSIRESLRFQHEYRLLASLALSRVVRVHGLLPYHAGFIIVEEDYGACDLASLLEGKSLALADFWPIAEQMAEGLAQLHEHKIIHKDIHLGNVLIEPHTKAVKWTDFGHSTLIEGETPEASAPGMIEGNLA